MGFLEDDERENVKIKVTRRNHNTDLLLLHLQYHGGEKATVICLGNTNTTKWSLPDLWILL